MKDSLINQDLNKDINAQRQLPKLKSLLKKYRQVKALQSSLLQLSELASTVTDMDRFYPALVTIIESALTTDSLHISLVDKNEELKIAYCHNPKEDRLLNNVEYTDWRKSLSGLVYLEKDILHCSAAERLALAKAGKIVLYGSSCVDWLGVPLIRDNKVIGVLALQSYDESLHFDDRDCQLVEFIAEHIVTAIDRVRSREILEENIQQRTKKLVESNEKLQREIAERQRVENIHNVLLAISELSATTDEIDIFYSALHQEVRTLVAADSFYIAIKNDVQAVIEFPYYKDEGVCDFDSRHLAELLTELAINTGKPMLIANGQLTTITEQGVVSQIPYQLNSGRQNSPQAWLAAPLYSNGKVFGILAIQHYFNADAYKVKDLDLIKFISQHIASAILRKRVRADEQKNNEELERLVQLRTEELQATNLNLRMQIEERRKAESRLYYEAHHDPLTKLPNRAMFVDRLTHAFRHVKRHSKNSFAVLFIDLDRFKIINDTLGHQAGDEFLIEIASRLVDCVRENDVLARLGGDEFVVLLDSLQSHEDIEEVTSRIINAIEEPFAISGNTLYSNASIGIALSNTRYTNASEILRDADAAMYQAKGLGRGRYVFFDESMREQLLASMTLEQELRIAIKEQQFELHYQTITDLDLSNAIGFEALLRWNHPTKGTLTPSEFLFMAEETGMIVEIERWIIKEVGQQLSQWQHNHEYFGAFIGINLSGRYLIQPNQLQDLMSLIKSEKIEPQQLILEFNESAFSQQAELALKSLRKLKEFGVKLALDDYGAGLSSFNFLHSYPFEFIKLDRSFIRSLNNAKQLSLVKALHDLGENFGYRLVAEGIESEEMLLKLQSVGCEYGQGYHISRPQRMAEYTHSKKKHYA